MHIITVALDKREAFGTVIKHTLTKKLKHNIPDVIITFRHNIYTTPNTNWHYKSTNRQQKYTYNHIHSASMLRTIKTKRLYTHQRNTYTLFTPDTDQNTVLFIATSCILTNIEHLLDKTFSSTLTLETSCITNQNTPHTYSTLL